MKKLIALTTIVLFSFIANAQYFDGVYIGGDLATVVSKYKTKGYTLRKTFDGGVLMKGIVSYSPVEIYIVTTPISKKVYKVAAYFEEKTSWYSLKTEYKKYLQILKDKYGSPDSQFDYFEEPYYEGDGYEMSAVALEKVHYTAFWIGNDNTNIAVDITKWKQVSLTYENALNAQLKSKEEKTKETNTF